MLFSFFCFFFPSFFSLFLNLLSQSLSKLPATALTAATYSSAEHLLFTARSHSRSLLSHLHTLSSAHGLAPPPPPPSAPAPSTPPLSAAERALQAADAEYEREVLAERQAAARARDWAQSHTPEALAEQQRREREEEEEFGGSDEGRRRKAERERARAEAAAESERQAQELLQALAELQPMQDSPQLPSPSASAPPPQPSAASAEAAAYRSLRAMCVQLSAAVESGASQLLARHKHLTHKQQRSKGQTQPQAAEAEAAAEEAGEEAQRVRELAARVQRVTAQDTLKKRVPSASIRSRPATASSSSLSNTSAPSSSSDSQPATLNSPLEAVQVSLAALKMLCSKLNVRLSSASASAAESSSSSSSSATPAPAPSPSAPPVSARLTASLSSLSTTLHSLQQKLSALDSQRLQLLNAKSSGQARELEQPNVQNALLLVSVGARHSSV